MCTLPVSLGVIAGLAFLPSAADDVRRVTITDAGSPVPGMVTVEKIDGTLNEPLNPGGTIPQMPGWPLTVARHQNFVPARGVVFADLDNDDDLELIVPGTTGFLYAWHHTGVAVAGFPISGMTGFPQYAPSVGDIDDDGDLEIVQTTRGFTNGGRLYAFSHTGQVLPGFPKNLNNNNMEYSPTLADLDDNGDLEIIVGERSWPTGLIHVFDHDGNEWSGNWPVAIDHVPAMGYSVGDVDEDGEPEIFTASYNSMYLINADGTLLPGWPRQIAGSNFSYQCAALADLNNDGDLEIIVGSHQGSAGCYIFNHDGTPLPGWPRLYGTWSYCPPTITDLDDDGALEIIAGRAGGFSNGSACFWVWNTAGQVRQGFPMIAPTTFGGGSEGPLNVSDIDGDNILEIFADHNVMSGGQGFLFGVDDHGAPLPGFPIRTNGFTYMNSATIGDVDNDGDLELGVLSYHDFGVDVNLYDLNDQTAPTSRDWRTYHARNTRGGLYAPPTGTIADLMSLQVLVGSLTSGGVNDLDLSDNVVVQTRSGFGTTFVDLHNLTMLVRANTDAPSPATLEVSIESRISHTAGTARISLRNWDQNRLDQIGSHAIGQSEETRTFSGIAADPYVDADGDIEVTVKHIVFIPIFAFRFDSYFDWVEIGVE